MTARKIRLGELGTWGSGGTPLVSRADYFGGDIPWLIIEDLNDGFVDRTARTITRLGLENSSAKIVPPGTLLIAMYGSIGKLGIPRIECATNQAIAYCKCDPSKVDTRFLFHLLLNERSRFLHAGRGGTQQNINQEFLREYEVWLPALSEQQRIAKQLEQADRLRRTRRYALELSDSFLPAAFLELFGDHKDSWHPLTVEELAAPRRGSIRTGPFGSQLLHSEFTDGGIAVLGIDNAVSNRFEWAERRFISPAKYEELKRYTVFPGDVLITIMGTCGRCAVVPDGMLTAINTKHLCCITLDRTKCLPVFLHGAFLHHPEIRRQLGVLQKGAIMDGLNMEIIKGLRFPLPPLQLQQKFAALVERHERLRASQREALRQAEHLFQTLLHQAFSPAS